MEAGQSFFAMGLGESVGAISSQIAGDFSVRTFAVLAGRTLGWKHGREKTGVAREERKWRT